MPGGRDRSPGVERSDVDERTISDDQRARRTSAAVDELRHCLQAAREELVLANSGVATAIARRYRNRGEAMDELVQTAYVGLVKAANGFVPDRAPDFLAY